MFTIFKPKFIRLCVCVCEISASASKQASTQTLFETTKIRKMIPNQTHVLQSHVASRWGSRYASNLFIRLLAFPITLSNMYVSTKDMHMRKCSCGAEHHGPGSKCGKCLENEIDGGQGAHANM